MVNENFIYFWFLFLLLGIKYSGTLQLSEHKARPEKLLEAKIGNKIIKEMKSLLGLYEQSDQGHHRLQSLFIHSLLSTVRRLRGGNGMAGLVVRMWTWCLFHFKGVSSPHRSSDTQAKPD